MDRKAIRIFCMLGVVAMGMAAASCKKKEEDETKNSFAKSPVISVPRYVNPGDKLVITPKGTDKDGKGGDFGYYWTASPVKTQRDTVRREGDVAMYDGTFEFTVPDTLCDITFACVAFAEEYYTSSASAVATIVKPGEGLDVSVTGNDIFGSDSRVTDSRDGKKYYYAEIGNLLWTRTNMAYQGEEISTGLPYWGSKAMTDVFGVYYNWNDAIKACPEGWRLPTGEDWNGLAAALGVESPSSSETYPGIAGKMMVKASFNGNLMWEYWPQVKIDNSSRFSALPTGYAYLSSEGGVFSDFYSYGAWWTADSMSDSAGEDKAVYRYIYVTEPDVKAALADKEAMLLPVRCVKEK